MKRKGLKLLAYGLHILLILLLLFLVNPLVSLVVSALLVLDMALLLLIVSLEPWQSLSVFPLMFIVLTSPFIILWFSAPRSGISYFYGVLLILAGLVLFSIEIAIGWRSYNLPLKRRS